MLLTVKKRQQPCHDNRDGKGLLVNREKIRMPEVEAWQQMTQHTHSVTLRGTELCKEMGHGGKKDSAGKKSATSRRRCFQLTGAVKRRLTNLSTFTQSLKSLQSPCNNLSLKFYVLVRHSYNFCIRSLLTQLTN